MPVWIPIAAVVLLLGYLLLRFNRFWIYSTFDRATRRPTDRIPDEYDRPRYLKLNSNGEVDTTVRWPGWDGWYFFILPRDTTLPVKMIRSSLMTGLYGLEGIDNYERLLFRLSTFDAVEYLSLTPTAITTPAGVEQRNNLSQHYFPRRWHLWMQPQKVDIAITGQQIGKDEEFDEYGRIRGAWPDYHVKFLNPEAGISCSATFRAENVVWWADVSGVFTYFAIFGQFEGQIKYALGTKKTDPHKIEGGGCIPFPAPVAWNMDSPANCSRPTACFYLSACSTAWCRRIGPFVITTSCLSEMVNIAAASCRRARSALTCAIAGASFGKAGIYRFTASGSGTATIRNLTWSPRIVLTEHRWFFTEGGLSVRKPPKARSNTPGRESGRPRRSPRI